jgi:DNA repair exonuclease SbcCD ATPase subunit
VSTNGAWQELYRAALVELRSDEMRQRIEDAKKAIQQRMAELRRDDSSCIEEAQALDDALRGLRVLASTECKPLRSPLSGLTQGDAA